jgi:hypothetical protein
MYKMKDSLKQLKKRLPTAGAKRESQPQACSFTRESA